MTDDAEALQRVVDELGCHQPIGRAPVHRNGQDVVAQLGTPALDPPDRVPPELPDLSVEQLLEELPDLEGMIPSVPHDGQAPWEALAARAHLAPPPSPDPPASRGSRLRLLTRDGSEHGSRWALDQRWRRPGHEKRDGPNQVTEPSSGPAVKARYRPRRGYQRKESIRNVSRLVAGVQRPGADYDRGELVT